jgi:hypothetical protein
MLKQYYPNIIIGLIVASIVALAGWAWSQFINVDHMTSRILSPPDGSNVPHMVQFTGTYANLEKSNDLWLVVQPVESPKYHPQTSSIAKHTNNTWKAVAYIGNSTTDNVGDKFVVLLVSTNVMASKTFSSYLDYSTLNNTWNGLDQLPAGTVTLHSINVVRQ